MPAAPPIICLIESSSDDEEEDEQEEEAQCADDAGEVCDIGLDDNRSQASQEQKQEQQEPEGNAAEAAECSADDDNVQAVSGSDSATPGGGQPEAARVKTENVAAAGRPKWVASESASEGAEEDACVITAVITVEDRQAQAKASAIALDLEDGDSKSSQLSSPSKLGFQFSQQYSPVCAGGASARSNHLSGGQLVLDDDGESLIIEMAGEIFCVQRDTRDVFATRASSKPELVGQWDDACSRIIFHSTEPAAEADGAAADGLLMDDSNGDDEGYRSDASTLSGGCSPALSEGNTSATVETCDSDDSDGGDGAGIDDIVQRITLIPLGREEDGHKAAVPVAERLDLMNHFPSTKNKKNKKQAQKPALPVGQLEQSFVTRLRPVLEPLVVGRGVGWKAVAPALELIASEDELAEALANPAVFVQGLLVATGLDELETEAEEQEEQEEQEEKKKEEEEQEQEQEEEQEEQEEQEQEQEWEEQEQEKQEEEDEPVKEQDVEAEQAEDEEEQLMRRPRGKPRVMLSESEEDESDGEHEPIEVAQPTLTLVLEDTQTAQASAQTAPSEQEQTQSSAGGGNSKHDKHDKVSQNSKVDGRAMTSCTACGEPAGGGAGHLHPELGCLLCRRCVVPNPEKP